MDEVEIEYTNYKGRRSLRRIKPERIVFQQGNPYHPEPQWLLFATDLEDGQLKAWAMNNIHRWTTVGDRESRRMSEMTFRCDKCHGSFSGLVCKRCKDTEVSGSGAFISSGLTEFSKRQISLTDTFLKTLTKNKRIIITDKDGNPYLERVYLNEQDDGSKTYLHIIYQSDDDRDMHNHPFNFTSRIVYGSYINHMKTGSVTYSEGQTNIMRADDFHRLEVLRGPVVTIVDRGPKIREWGFDTEDGWVNHKEYLNKKFGVGNWVTGD